MAHLARDLMTRDVACVRDNLDLRELSKLFVERGITGAPVIDEVGDLVGVVSQTDVLRYAIGREDELTVEASFYESVRLRGKTLPSGWQVADSNTGRVSDVMTPIVHTVAADAAAPAIARKMLKEHIHRVIVTTDRKIVGIISALDLLKALSDQVDKPARARAPKAASRKAAPARKAPAGTKPRVVVAAAKASASKPKAGAKKAHAPAKAAKKAPKKKR